MDPSQSSPLKKVRRGRHVGTPSAYKGVRMRTWGKWVSEIRVPKTGQRIWLGSYDAPEKAARAYDAAQYCIRGEGGQFNFPAERRPKLPEGAVSSSLSEKDIKAIAFDFASSEASQSSRSLLRETSKLVKEEPALPNVSASDATNAVHMEAYAPRTVVEADPSTVEDFQLDDFLMLDVEWIDSL